MIHINRFIDKITMTESKNLKQLSMTTQEAKGLHADITKLLLHLQTLQAVKTKSDEVVKVEVGGGEF